MSQPAEPKAAALKPAEPKAAGQSTDDFIKDIQQKLQGKKYTGKADELQEDLRVVDTKIRRYEREVKTLTNPETEELKIKAKDFLAGYNLILNRLLEIKRGLTALSRPNTSTSATAVASALSGLKLGGAPRPPSKVAPVAGPAGGAAAPVAGPVGGAAAPVAGPAGGAAAPARAVQEVHVCPADRDELFRLGGDELKDGNCFYSSVYRAALHHSEKGLVNRIYELFGGKPPAASNLAASAGGGAAGAKPIPDEGTFIRTLRAKTAQLMRTGVFEEIKQRRIRNVNADPTIGINRATEDEKEALRQQQRDLVFSLFDLLWDNSEGENNFMYTSWLEETPTQIQNFFKITHANKTFRNIYPEQNPENEQKFYNDMATFIQTWKVYASETDISVVRHHLSKSGIALEAVSAIDTKKCMYFGRMPVLWLFKQAYRNAGGKLVSGNHFGYFRKDDCSTLHDPCSGERINLDHLSHPRNPVKYLEEKIKIIAAAHAARLEGGGASAAASAAAANEANAAAFGLTPAELNEQKKAWAKLRDQKPSGNPRKSRKTRKLLRRSRSRSRRIQRKA